MFQRDRGDSMAIFIRMTLVILGIAFASAFANADGSRATAGAVRVLSWNISGKAFVTEPQAFRALLAWADPDVVLLDEVLPSVDPEVLVDVLETLRPAEDEAWHVVVGASGGRQRGLIASRAPQEALSEFASIVPYPDADKRLILGKMTPHERANPGWSMDGGIPVNGAIIRMGDRRLLVVIADLQCCGDSPEGWQEIRRRVEAREIRRLIGRVLESHPVDGVVFAGDFNMVNSTLPMALLTGAYPEPHSGLIPAELYHSDGTTTWTWDGRGTPFPSNSLDYQLYGPLGLKVLSGLILDTERVPHAILDRFGLETDSSMRPGRHRPLVVEYGWK